MRTNHPVPREDELIAILTATPWFIDVLATAAAVKAPDAWVGAGAIRDLVWDVTFGSGFDPAAIKDVDFVFFDPDDLSPEHDDEVEAALTALDPSIEWDAKNQAAVHLWYPKRFGLTVEPLRSTTDAIATWPEYATCVGARWFDGGIEIAAPYGLDDLLDGLYRRNPDRVTEEEYERRLARKNPTQRWPGVRVVTAQETRPPR